MTIMTNGRRITSDDLDIAVERYARALRNAGIRLSEGAYLELRHGSRTNGIAYDLHVTGGLNGTGESPPPVGEGHLGFTKAEAFDRMARMSRCIEDMTTRLAEIARLEAMGTMNDV